MERGAPSDRLHRIAQGVLRHITVYRSSLVHVLIHEAVIVSEWILTYRPVERIFGFRQCNRGQGADNAWEERRGRRAQTRFGAVD
jgi:hypothetical protein